jgi:2-C-methyl-D-erythritol 4-phosphate cytidylyltransferase
MVADVALLVVAAGNGIRMGGSIPKTLLSLGGKPLVLHAIQRGLATGQVGTLIVVAAPQGLDATRDIVEPFKKDVWVQVTSGGPTRVDSVQAGLSTLIDQQRSESIVLVHDAARPLASTSLFNRVINAIREGASAVIPGLAVVDTIKHVNTEGYVLSTVDRSALRAVQTPQGFQREILLRAHDQASAKHVTDDASLVEQLDEYVLLIDGDPLAMKITSPTDLIMAEALLASEGT